jgi:predicted AlkP superfamily pyrophosphatase or phosphodiesterase
MNRFCLIIVFLVLVLTGGFAQTTKHVVLITIDGLRPEFYLDPSWGAVNLQQLKEAGTFAKGVNGIFPTVTYPSHTTLLTGEKPAFHGIYFNNAFQANGPSADWHWYFEDIKVPTLWDAVRNAGLTSGSVLWPVSVGAPVDYNIPDIWTLENTDRLEITGRYATPQGFWDEVQQNATGRLEPNDFNLDKDYLSMDDNVARIAAYILRKYKPAFTTVHLPVVDHAEHADGRDGEQVRRAVAGADRNIRTIVEALDKAGIRENTAIIITGDHGFVDRHTNFYPNILLAEAGLIKDVSTGEWKARFHSAGGSAFLYLKEKNDSRSLAQVKKILDDLPASQKKMFRVIEGEELRKSGADSNAVLALAAEKGYAFSGSISGEVVKASRGGSHGYFPDFADIQTGFIGSGSGLRKGVELSVIEMVDIAPLIAKLLGLDFKKADDKLAELMLAR